MPDRMRRTAERRAMTFTDEDLAYRCRSIRQKFGKEYTIEQLREELTTNLTRIAAYWTGIKRDGREWTPEEVDAWCQENRHALESLHREIMAIANN